MSDGSALLLAAALALVAFLYASVGHAGATGTIAVLTLAGWSAGAIKPLALILNTVVAAVGCWTFLRAGHWPGRAFWPVYVLALPAAFLGGAWHLPVLWLQRLLGLVLLASAWRLARQFQEPADPRPPHALTLALSGGGLGLLAGLTGTGGGVFLSPLLLLGRWCGTRQTAAVSVLFILLNSLGGLAGLGLSRPDALTAVLQPQLLLWLALVLPAGALGAHLGSRRWPLLRVRRCLALVLVLAGGKLLAAG